MRKPALGKVKRKGPGCADTKRKQRIHLAWLLGRGVGTLAWRGVCKTL